MSWILGCVEPEPPIPEPRDWAPGDPVVEPAQPPRNVLMLSIDTLRRDHIDRYGPLGKGYMPFLSSWLESAVVLDDHQQCSDWTYASTSCTLSGRYHEDSGFFPKLTQDHRLPLPNDQPTLARELGKHGFYSILLSSNTWLSEEWNNAQGYTRAEPPTGGSTRFLTSQGLSLLSERLQQPDPPERWFLHVHVIEPHVPYTPPEQYLSELDQLEPIPWDLETRDGHYEITERWPELSGEERALLEAHLRARYRGELRFLDDQLALWWSELVAEGWLQDTLVVIWSDHGEQFWEHGHQSHAWGLSAEENDALLGFWAEDLQPRGFDGPTHAIDLVPTVLHALGLPPSERAMGEVAGTASPFRARFSATVGRAGPLQSVTQEGYKLQLAWSTGRLRLWERSEDPAEQLDRFDPDHPMVPILWPQLEAQVRKMAPLVPEATLVWPDL
ncbi:MAG TPA: hypothetical protein ENK18_13040 [Deltaproteobacteria bacterium]|nr:hypothetical protein [Deltaproteobacteria bacterium]